MAMVKLALLLAVLLLAIWMADSMVVESLETEHGGGEGEMYETERSRGQYGPGSLRGYQCGGQCNRRCSKTQYKKPCLFFCNKCCAKCLCVPPGFYGNKGVCPCYNNWKTKRGGPKCP